MGILESVFQSATILVALAGAYLVAFWFVLVVWAYRDIESRSRNVVTQVFSTLIVVLFFVPGVLLYLILRPKETLDQSFQRSLEEEYLLQDLEELPLCPTCHRYVDDDFALCPHCHSQLRESCTGCSRLVDLRWAICPYCSTVQGGQVEKPERVEAPAARWIAPERGRRRVVAVSAEKPTFDRVRTVATAPAAPNPAGESVAVDTGGNGSATDDRPLPLTLVSGMRSIVRTAERTRLVGQYGERSSRQTSGTQNGDGPHRVFRPFQNGSVVPGADTTPAAASNGNGVEDHPVSPSGRFADEPVKVPSHDDVKPIQKES